MRNTFRSILLAVSLGAAALAPCLLMAPTAAADPGGQPLAIHCDTLGDLEVIVVGRATLAPGLAVGNNQVAVPYRITVSGIFSPTEGDPEPFTDEFVRPAPQNGRLDHCTFHQEGTLPDGTFVLDGTISITYTP